VLDLAAIRDALCAAVSAAIPELNCYPYPDSQPEFPAMMVPFADLIEFHAVYEYDGSTITIPVQLLVADPDVSVATHNLEALIVAVWLTLEAAVSSTVFVNVVCAGVRNFRRRDQGEGMSCDLAVTVHA
jgi:hypothetical protein